MGSWHRLTLLRPAAISAAIALVFAALVADATVLAYLNGNGIHSGPISGAGGWAMFASVVSLVALPLLLTRAARVQRWVNRTGVELAILATCALFFFIAGIVLAAKAGDSKCVTRTLCRRVRAATAFCWLALAALVGALGVVALVARVQSRLGLPLFTAYAFDVEGQEITQAAPRDMHAAALALGGAAPAEKPPGAYNAYEYGSAYMN
ncbi:hypothetical protein IWW55_002984 [Coemansia sp. RSA 2706]|nr:hypothetical protein LPJ63_003111 [Coemansia sp. RSA 2711]KAJ1842305.1 hypothetical protein LPJ70_003874 [Coemansia sp. RSA 2708]KAJ2303324.1 hypothetical protein IWW55_002984 [Coemansia sp. RSA 2706]KAJ2321403.1 hypothetical protein IWW51_004427 [Coemansia sp. RSA 2702]KAJ2372317.1 hypothetical protein H4S02_009250 [Coemansia sp. RSA 2611]KAJ2716353.1 hypothetical protein H4R23_005463 [Coemansia sp. Cherry 401B]